ncbi:23S rRNA (uracil(1939)-C(5))-methyltransferase RlmD [candidate division WOR-3 bacterium]|nr:23S rRNA (uracil(1939)-C(5))-methyltransferase RlmD [candidate division WOR-3 bacterium]
MVAGNLRITVEKVVAGGDGLTHLPDGRVLFVPFSLPGERLDVSIVKQKKDYAVGRIEGIVEEAANRVEPSCPYYTECGGCQLQHVTYEGEIEIKKSFLKETLVRHAKVQIEPEAVYPSACQWGYRTKSEHPAAPHDPNPLIGYYRRRTHKVVDVHHCPVLDPESVADLDKLRELLGRTTESIYDERTGTGNLRYVILRRSSDGNRMIGLVTFTEGLTGPTVVELVKDFSNLSGIVQSINPYKGNRILGDENQIISGQDHLSEQIGNLELRVSFPSFFQANHLQAERIVNVVEDFLKPQSEDVLVDAYAGVGMIGLALSSKVKGLTAIESSPSAVADGKRNAERNSRENVKWLQGQADDLLTELPCDLLILDPPRRGLTDKVISSVIKTRPRRISYVSCNPSTWARDIHPLLEAGFKLTRLAMIDLFPHTAHLEIVSLLEAA